MQIQLKLDQAAKQLLCEDEDLQTRQSSLTDMISSLRHFRASSIPRVKRVSYIPFLCLVRRLMLAIDICTCPVKPKKGRRYKPETMFLTTVVDGEIHARVRHFEGEGINFLSMCKIFSSGSHVPKTAQLCQE